MDEEFFRALIEEIIDSKISTIEEVDKIRREMCRKFHPKVFPSYIHILTHATNDEFKKLKFLQSKPTRTISGVAPLAIMTKPLPCPHGKCSFCPGGPESFFGDIPQSYTGREPATMRAIRNRYDPYLQVFNRLEQYQLLNQNLDKIEMIIMGGTFPSVDENYQEEFIKYAFKAMNDFGKLFYSKGFDFVKFKEFFELPTSINNKKRELRVQEKILKLKKECTLEAEQLRNETAKVRCIALAIETRPDYGFLEHGNVALRLGVTRVELGIQSVFDDVLKKIERGHTVEDSIKSIQQLKNLGFKLNFHYMIGLPGSDYEKDLDGLKRLFSDERFRPDMLKIYPCLVMPGTKLFNDWENGKFEILSTEKATKMLAEFKALIPTYCRVSRIMRDIPTKVTSAGIEITNFRQEVKKYMGENNLKCSCIRCREAGHLIKNNDFNPKNIELIVNHYKASCGDEFFISFEDVKNDILFGYCRLRFPSESLRNEITMRSAIIRELHVYGKSVKLGKKDNLSYQHKGLGKKLMQKAEDIARENNKNKLLVISGIGVKEYYHKMGYKKDGPYMSKLI